MRRRSGDGTPGPANRTLFYVVAFLVFGLGACAPPGGGGGKVVATLTVTEANANRRVSADGALESVRQVPVAPLVQGEVETVLVENGQSVEVGQDLFQIDTSALHDQLSALQSGGGGGGGGGGGSSDAAEGPDLEGQLAQLDKGIDELVNGLNQGLDALTSSLNLVPFPAEDPNWMSLRTQIAQQKIQLQWLAQTFKIQSRLGLQGDAMIAQSNAAFAAGLGGALGGAAGAGSNPQITSQERELERQIRDATVEAPISGVVAFAPLSASTGGLAALGGGATNAASASAANAQGLLHPGSLVQLGQTVLSIYDMGGVRVRVGIDEVDITAVREGQKVDVAVDAFPDSDLTGTVSRIDVNPTVSDSGGVTYTVKIDIPVEQVPGWRPGMTATADIRVDDAGNGVELPTSAIVPEEGKDYVFLVEDGKAVKTEVTTRKTSTGVVAVGLSPGDVVVTNGASELVDGDAVSTGTK